jgi:predicted acetyltransferase
MLRLRPLRPDDETAVRTIHDQMEREDGFTFALNLEPGMSWTEYLEKHRAHQRGDGVPANLVPATFLIAEVNREIVGRVSIRHELNEMLAHEGGHIGYGVVPAHRRRGYATEMLRQSLIVARAIGVDRVLVTCDDDNIASATVIERNGGIFESVITDTIGGKAKRSYWID